MSLPRGPRAKRSRAGGPDCAMLRSDGGADAIVQNRGASRSGRSALQSCRPCRAAGAGGAVLSFAAGPALGRQPGLTPPCRQRQERMRGSRRAMPEWPTARMPRCRNRRRRAARLGGDRRGLARPGRRHRGRRVVGHAGGAISAMAVDGAHLPRPGPEVGAWTRPTPRTAACGRRVPPDPLGAITSLAVLGDVVLAERSLGIPDSRRSA